MCLSCFAIIFANLEYFPAIYFDYSEIIILVFGYRVIYFFYFINLCYVRLVLFRQVKPSQEHIFSHYVRYLKLSKSPKMCKLEWPLKYMHTDIYKVYTCVFDHTYMHWHMHMCCFAYRRIYTIQSEGLLCECVSWYVGMSCSCTDEDLMHAANARSTFAA